MTYAYRMNTVPPRAPAFTQRERDAMKARGVPAGHIADYAKRMNAEIPCGSRPIDAYKRWLVEQGRVDENGKPILPDHVRLIRHVKDHPHNRVEVSDAEAMDLLKGKAKPARRKPAPKPADSALMEALRRMVEANTLKDIIDARNAARELIAA